MYQLQDCTIQEVGASRLGFIAAALAAQCRCGPQCGDVCGSGGGGGGGRRRRIPFQEEEVSVDYQLSPYKQVFISDDLRTVSLPDWHLTSFQELAPREAICRLLKNGDAVICHEVTDDKLALPTSSKKG